VHAGLGFDSWDVDFHEVYGEYLSTVPHIDATFRAQYPDYPVEFAELQISQKDAVKWLLDIVMSKGSSIIPVELSTQIYGRPRALKYRDLLDDEYAHQRLVVLAEERIRTMRDLYSEIVADGCRHLPSASELVRRGVCDPVPLFIKQEPHKLSKVKAGRFRLISSVSKLDYFVEWLYTHFGAEKSHFQERWATHAISIGLGGLADGTPRAVNSWVRQHAARCEDAAVVMADVTAFDWNCSLALLLVPYRWMQLMKPDVAPLAFVRAVCCARALFELPTGELIEKTRLGGQLSGRYRTSLDNCLMMMHRLTLAAEDPAAAVRVMGDDSLLIVPSVKTGLVKANLERGVTLSDWQVGTPNDYEFCGIRWSSAGPFFVRAEKALFRLFSPPPNEQALASVLELLDEAKADEVRSLFEEWCAPAASGGDAASPERN
jgi:hypothetical protein